MVVCRWEGQGAACHNVTGILSSILNVTYIANRMNTAKRKRGKSVREQERDDTDTCTCMFSVFHAFLLFHGVCVQKVRGKHQQTMMLIIIYPHCMVIINE